MGKATHAEGTWTDEGSGVNWIRVILPETLPSARILAFQYNANVAFCTSIAGVEEQAINLLGCLMLRRKDNPTRPIIFVVHSLGGIIVKEALATAFERHETYPMIWTFTYSIFFLAVPHTGSPCASWGAVAADVVRAVTNSPSNSLLKSVRQHSNYNQHLNIRFEPLHEAYKFYSWIEGLPTPPFGIIVPQQSATLGLQPSQETRRFANRDHKTICKFSGADDREWIELSQCIVEAANAATKSVHFSPTMRHRKPMFETQAVEDKEKEKPASLLQAFNQAKGAIKSLNEFRNGEVYLRKQEEAQHANDSIWTLATLLAAIGPILTLLSSFVFGWGIGNIPTNTLLDLLPSKEEALEKAQQGQEAEEKVMKVEEWAIEELNNHLGESLGAFRGLEHALRASNLAGEENANGLQLSSVRNNRRLLLQQMEFIANELHKHQMAFNFAQRVFNKIKAVRQEAADKDKREFYITTGAAVKEAQEDQEKDAPGS
ncbi:kinesin [Fusarium beomiforme]|uniref:Kinesin n=1 Tax=Fusarium beomiforme TaxID=44412 RepID=A0A9P5A849_9HYPO|nr:kinesin [Fusarium beomiforme]